MLISHGVEVSLSALWMTDMCHIILIILQRMLNSFTVAQKTLCSKLMWFWSCIVWLLFLSHKRNGFYLPVMPIYPLAPQLSGKRKNKRWLPYPVRFGPYFFVVVSLFYLVLCIELRECFYPQFDRNFMKK